MKKSFIIFIYFCRNNQEPFIVVSNKNEIIKNKNNDFFSSKPITHLKVYCIKGCEQFYLHSIWKDLMPAYFAHWMNECQLNIFLANKVSEFNSYWGESKSNIWLINWELLQVSIKCVRESMNKATRKCCDLKIVCITADMSWLIRNLNIYLYI